MKEKEDEEHGCRKCEKVIYKEKDEEKEEKERSNNMDVFE